MYHLIATINIEDVLARFGETVGIWHIIGMVVLMAFSGYLVLRQRIDLVILLMFVTSLMTTVASESLASASFIGRWFFLLMSALLVLFRIGRFHGPTCALAAAWACINIFGLMYTPSFEKGMVRGIFFSLAVPGLILVMTPPFAGVDDIVRLLRRMAIVGVFLAALHFAFVIVAPQGGGTARFKSAFTSGQVMSLATAAATLPMIWALLSKNAGKWAPFFLISTLINLMVMIASTQRTALFSLAGAVAILLAFYRLRGVIIALVSGAALALIAWPIITYLVSADFLYQRLFVEDSSGRTKLWEWGITEGLKSPFIGHGSDASTADTEIRFGHKFHEAYIAIFYDLGLMGLTVFLAMIANGMLTSWRIIRRKHAPKTRAIGVFLLATIAMVAAQGFAETGLADTANQTAMMFYLALGLASSVLNMREQEAEPEPAQATRFAAARPPWYGPPGGDWRTRQGGIEYR